MRRCISAEHDQVGQLWDFVGKANTKTTETSDGLRTTEEKSSVPGKKLEGKQGLREGVHTARLHEKATREKERVSATANTKEDTRGSKFDNCSGPNSGQTAEAASRDTAENSSLSCLYTNVNSIVNKMSELRERAMARSYDIMGAAESWATEFINDAV